MPFRTLTSPRTLAHWIEGKPRGQAGARTLLRLPPAHARRRRNPLTRPRALRGSLRAAVAHRPPATTPRRNWRRLRNWRRRPGAGRRTGPAGAPDLRRAWGTRAEGRGGLCSWGSSGVLSEAGIGQNERAYGGGDASGRVPLVMQSKRIGWRQLTTGSRHRMVLRLGEGQRQRSPPPCAPAARHFSPASRSAKPSALEPRTGCQTHSGRGGKFMSSSPAAPRMPTAQGTEKLLPVEQKAAEVTVAAT